MIATSVSPNSVRRALALLLTFAVAAAGCAVFSAQASAAATYKQTSCTKLAKKVKKSKGKKKKAAKKKLAACKQANSQMKSAFTAIKGGRYTGRRGDGATVDLTLCSNGTYTSKTTSGGSTGTSTGLNWNLASVKYTGSSFIAVIEDKTNGKNSAFGLGFTGGVWQVGVARSFGEVESLGNVTRTPAC